MFVTSMLGGGLHHSFGTLGAPAVGLVTQKKGQVAQEFSFLFAPPTLGGAFLNNGGTEKTNWYCTCMCVVAVVVVVIGVVDLVVVIDSYMSSSSEI